jgi:TetR/AcrR family transcriptional repressor of nem operon
MNLVKATGVGKKGLYTVFGNKYDFYIKAMEYYKCMQAEELLYEIEKQGAGYGEIRDLFMRALKFTQGDYGSRGCLVCNAMAEFGDKEPEIWRATSTHIDRFRKAFREALATSLKKREIRSSINVKKQANFLSSVLQSLMLMSRAGTEYSVMKDTVDLTLQSMK